MIKGGSQIEQVATLMMYNGHSFDSQMNLFKALACSLVEKSSFKSSLIKVHRIAKYAEDSSLA